MQTFYWHDYETFGADPVRDRPSQFAGVRTDAELNEIGDPLLIYCRPAADYLPHPEACLITGITPQTARSRGLDEHEFIARIVAELAQPGTCGVGYNSIRFDDEVTRHTLYRNFHDPYEREWRNGNSRWDLIDVMRMARALRPEGLSWPDYEDGRPSFRLEHLTRANGISHGAAHDALSDTRATVALARLLRQHQPKLFAYALKARDKNWVKLQLNVVERKPLLHFSSRFSAEHGSAALVVPLALHPVNANAIIACNLLLDPEPLARFDAATLRQYLYTRSSELPADMQRVPLKEIHANKSPMLAPASMLDEATAERLGIDMALCMSNLERVLAIPDLARKLREIYLPGEQRQPGDPDHALYEGFLGDHDRRLATRVRAASPQELAQQRFPFEDPRLPELLLRYRARNFPQTLDQADRALWREHCAERLHGAPLRNMHNCDSHRQRVAELRVERAEDPAALAMLDALDAWREELCASPGGTPGE
jgi:exodeoxyribonuclease I